MTTIQMEVMLLRWAETSNGGATLVLQLCDPDDLEPFKSMTLAKGKQAGQRLQAVFVEIDEQEQPVQVKGGELAQLAGRWCNDVEFQDWVAREFPEDWGLAEAPTDAGKAAAVVKVVCDIDSRRELDHNPIAAVIFDGKFRKPFMLQRGALTR